MNFGIQEVYLEPNTNFKISPNVIGLIMKEIQELFSKYKLDQYQPSHYFTVYLTTSSQQTTLDTSGPVEEEDFIEYTIHFPYKDVIEADNIIEAYLDFLFKGLTIILANYEVSKTDLDEALSKIKKEIRSDFKYHKDNSQKVLSYDEIQAILKKLGAKDE